MSNPLESRVAVVAVRDGTVIKPLSLSFITNQVQSLCTEGVEPTDAEISEHLRRLRPDLPAHLGHAAPMAEETATAKLDRMNAQAVPARKPRQGKQEEFTDKQRAHLAKLNPGQRLDYANEIANAKVQP